MNYFFAAERPSEPNKYTLCINFDKVPLKYVDGCFYGLIFSKLLNISYADLCRLCRDSFSASIYGKGVKYPSIYFNSKVEIEKLVNLLNERMDLIMKERG